MGFLYRLTVASAAFLASPVWSQQAPLTLDSPPQSLPQAQTIKGARPQSNPKLLAPAAIKLEPALQRLAAPASLALPVKTDQVRIVSLRPISLKEAENLAEVNDPNLKAIASQVDQAQSYLRSKIAQWYPTLNLTANGFPNYTGGQQMQFLSQPTVLQGQVAQGQVLTSTNRWAMASSLNAQWDVVNPQRVPEVSAARDEFEKAKNRYLIALRELRLQTSQAYFKVQWNDERVRVGQQSVGASLISLRDAKARFQAGVATRLEVLQAETQLGRDRYLLDDNIIAQGLARRELASLLNLPQNVTPTAKEPLKILGLWKPSLQESIIAAYSFREELDNALLDVSSANSQANSALASVQPFMSIVNSLFATRFNGNEAVLVDLPGKYGYAVENSIGLNFNWRLFDGGASRSLYRQYKQKSQENEFIFSRERNKFRYEVEEAYYSLINANRNILTTTKEVLTTRESLRLARLRFTAGVTTQLEVQQTQRDLTQAELRYVEAMYNYNSGLAFLRRRTGLDSVAECRGLQLTSVRPAAVDSETVPIPPSPLVPACSSGSSLGENKINQPLKPRKV